jgi:citronellol/citronellal dehydrogenase
VLMLSPPPVLKPEWFAPYPAYAMAKFGMSLCVLAMAEEFKGQIAVNALWPRTTIATAAIRNVLAGDEGMKHCRTPQIIADAAWHIFNRPLSFSGNFLIDDMFLAQNGVTDFDQYRVDPSKDLMPDFFVPEGPLPPGVSLMAKS